jgi:hypothetical protein
MQLKIELREKIEKLTEEKQFADRIWNEYNSFVEWMNDAKNQIEAFRDAKIYTYL